MRSCSQIARELSDLLDGELPRLERIRIRAHLLLCRRCRHVQHSLDRTLEALRGLGQVPPGPPDEPG